MSQSAPCIGEPASRRPVPCPTKPAAYPPTQPHYRTAAHKPATASGLWPASLRELLGPGKWSCTSAWMQGVLLFPSNSCVCLLNASRPFWGWEGCLSARDLWIVGLSEAFRTYPCFPSVFKHALLRNFDTQCLGIPKKPIRCLQVKKLTAPTEQQTKQKPQSRLGMFCGGAWLGRLFAAPSQVGWENVEPGPEGWRFLWGYKPALPKKEGMVFFPFIPGLLLDTKMRTWLYRKPSLLAIISCACFCFYSLPGGASKLCQNLACSSSPRCTQAVTPTHQAAHGDQRQWSAPCLSCTASLQGGSAQDLDPESLFSRPFLLPAAAASPKDCN